MPWASNRLLELAGVHEKVDGGWKLTELGERFVHVVDEHNGYGGSASRSWSKTYFAPEMLDELNITPEPPLAGGSDPRMRATHPALER